MFLITHVQLSCASSSPELSNRVLFPNYFQLLVSDQNLAYGFYSIIQRYKWRRVSILVQDENLFTLVSLTEMLKIAGVCNTV